MTGPTISAVQDLRRALAAIAAVCDVILYSQTWDATQARQQLPGLLDRLDVRTDRVRQALRGEDGR
jgi:hypothetical protein